MEQIPPSVQVDDVSRLPFGFLEKYALSTDRRKLLNVKQTEEKEKEIIGENEGKPRQSVGINESGIVHGSIDYIYYYLLQCENEINEILKNANFKNEKSEEYKQLKQQFIDLSNEITQCFAKYNDPNYPRFAVTTLVTCVDVFFFFLYFLLLFWFFCCEIVTFDLRYCVMSTVLFTYKKYMSTKNRNPQKKTKKK